MQLIVDIQFFWVMLICWWRYAVGDVHELVTSAHNIQSCYCTAT